jgi:hypothetical protein
MSLRYSFRHLFFGGKLRPKRLYQILEDLDNSSGGSSDVAISDITDAELVEIVVTYTDDSTETIKVVAQTPSNP